MVLNLILVTLSVILWVTAAVRSRRRRLVFYQKLLCCLGVIVFWLCCLSWWSVAMASPEYSLSSGALCFYAYVYWPK